ncbi:spore germination protein [Brevibacillus sp. NRS-1366]|uniref:spore germination protein n=1 Tax=Brevibacillus sp. NRS-1366 TaxID=3233899 RepID=UPI003D1921BE
MPASVGSVHIQNNFGTIQFGDTANNSPKSSTKTFSGAGGGNNGNNVSVTNEQSETNTWVYGVDSRKRGSCPRRRPTKRFKKRERKYLKKRT